MITKTTLTNSITPLLLIGSLISGWLYLDTRYAHAEDTKKSNIQLRLQIEQKILQYEIDNQTKRLDYINNKELEGSITEADKRHKEIIKDDLDRLYQLKQQIDTLYLESL